MLSWETTQTSQDPPCFLSCEPVQELTRAEGELVVFWSGGELCGDFGSLCLGWAPWAQLIPEGYTPVHRAQRQGDSGKALRCRLDAAQTEQWMELRAERPGGKEGGWRDWGPGEEPQ